MKKPTTSTSKAQPKRRLGGAAKPIAQAERLIDTRIAELSRAADGGAWRGQVLALVRSLIRQTIPDVAEQWKWGVPVWAHPAGGIICTGESYKKAVKLTFAQGAKVQDPHGLFNASLDGHTRRAIDIHEGQRLNERAFKALVRAAAKVSRRPMKP